MVLTGKHTTYMIVLLLTGIHKTANGYVDADTHTFQLLMVLLMGYTDHITDDDGVAQNTEHLPHDGAVDWGIHKNHSKWWC